MNYVLSHASTCLHSQNFVSRRRKLRSIDLRGFAAGKSPPLYSVGMKRANGALPRALPFSRSLGRSRSLSVAAAAIAHLSRVAAVQGATESANCASGVGLISDSVHFHSAIFQFTSFPALGNSPPNSLQHPRRATSQPFPKARTNCSNLVQSQSVEVERRHRTQPPDLYPPCMGAQPAQRPSPPPTALQCVGCYNLCSHLNH